MKYSVEPKISALVGHSSLKQNSARVESSVVKMSSGKRINKAADDAAGLSIASKLNSQIKSMSQAVRNTNNAVSMVQVAEGGLSEVQGILSRMRELTIQAASDTNGDTERSYLGKEFEQMKDEIARNADSVRFMKNKFFDASIEKLTIQAGTSNSENDVIELDMREMVQTLDALGIFDANLRTHISSVASIDKIDYAIKSVSESRAVLGSLQSRLQTAASNLNNQKVNAESARSTIEDLDYALEVATYAKSKVMENAAISVVAHVNTGPDVLGLLLKD
ncbi:MAG: flagellin FliC [Deltaproteobacteria bacterium]|nr:MAG: flagellin FliC [Deltaproteobacteria bacterium]